MKLNKKKKVILIVAFNVVGITSILLIIWKLLPSLNNKKNTGEDLFNNTKSKFEKSLIKAEEKRDQILTKNKSIELYGNLFTDETSIKVDYKDANYTFQINDNTKIIGIDAFNSELNKQGDTEDNNYNIKDLTDGIKGLNFSFTTKATDHKIEMENLEVAIVLSEANVEEIEFPIEENDSIIERDSGVQNSNENSDAEENLNPNNLENEKKNISINRYGDLFGRDTPIKVNYFGVYKNYIFQIGKKLKIIGLDAFNKELNIQKDNETPTYNYTNINDLSELNIDEKYTIQKAVSKQMKDIPRLIRTYGHLKEVKMFLDLKKIIFKNKDKFGLKEDDFDVIFRFQYPEDDLDTWKANSPEYKKVKSIEIYGDLKSQEIQVDWNGTNYTFEIYHNIKIVGLDLFNEELNKQGDTTETNYTIQNLIDSESHLIFSNNMTPTIAKAKKASIETYGNLFADDASLDIYWMEKNFNDVMILSKKPGLKWSIFYFNKFVEELNIQRDRTVYWQELSINEYESWSSFKNNKIWLELNWISKISLEKYGELQYANITSDQNGELQFRVDGKEMIDEETFDREIINQAWIKRSEWKEKYAPFDKTNLTGYEKAFSIKTYGNLFASDASIKVDYDYKLDYTFQIGNKTKIISINDFNKELNKQDDITETNYTIQNLIDGESNLNFYDQNSLQIIKNKITETQTSIDTYGNLKNASVELNRDSELQFRVGFKQALNEIEFDTQFAIQHSREINAFDKNKLENYKQNKSIETYGDSKKAIVNYENNGLQFQVGIEQVLNENEFDTLFAIQYPDETNTFDKNTELKGYKKAKSIETYGDLKRTTTKLSDDKLNFIAPRDIILFEDDFNNELAIQYPDEINFTKADMQNYAKNKSIETYGELLNNSTSIKVDYNGTKYTFEIGGNTKIVGFEKLNTELNIQKDNSDPSYNYNNINEIPTSNFDEESTTRAKAKKDSIDFYGNFKNIEINVEINEEEIRYYTLLDGTKTIIGNYSELRNEIKKQIEIKNHKNIFFEYELNFNFSKEASEKLFGSLLSMKKLQISYIKNKINFQLHNDVLNSNYKEIIGLDNFLKILNIQKSDEDTEWTEEKITANQSLFNYFENYNFQIFLNKKVIRNESIDRYGNLFADNASIKVDWNGTKYTFKIKGEKKNFGLENFNIELNKQGDQTNTDYTFQNLIDGGSGLNFDPQKSPQKSENKKISIETYSDLQNASFKFDRRKELIINNDSDVVIEKDIFIREIKKQNINSEKITNKIASISQYGNLLNSKTIIAPIYLPYIDKFIFEIKSFESEEIKTIKDFDTLKRHLLFQGADNRIEGYTFSEMAQQTEYFNNSLEQENEDWKIWKSFETYGNLIKNYKKIICLYTPNKTKLKLPYKASMSPKELKQILKKQLKFHNFYSNDKDVEMQDLILQKLNFEKQDNGTYNSYWSFNEISKENPQQEGYTTSVIFNSRDEEFNFNLKNKQDLITNQKNLNEYIKELKSFFLFPQWNGKEITYHDFFENLANLELNFHETESLSSAKARAKEFSIEKYGNLKSSNQLNPIYVNYIEGENNLTFRMNSESTISTIEKFNKNLLYQGVPITKDISLLNFYKPQQSLYFDQASLEVARTAIKNKSIETYGNFIEEKIKIIDKRVQDYDLNVQIEKFKFQVGNHKIMENIDEFNLELKKQNLKPMNKENPDFLSETNYSFDFVGETEGRIYGILDESSILDIAYTGGKFTFRFENLNTKKTKLKIIGLDNLNKFLNSQDNPLFNAFFNFENLRTISKRLNIGIHHEDKIFNKKKYQDISTGIIKKYFYDKNSVEKYGDLTNQEIKITYEKQTDGNYIVFFNVKGGEKLDKKKFYSELFKVNGNDITFFANERNYRIQYFKFKVSKETFENILINRNKIISIETFGDLKDLNEVEVTFDGLNYTFQINGKEEILGLINLKEQITIQNDDQAIKFNDFSLTKANFLNFQELKKNIEQAESIYTYGDLTNTDTIFNYHNENENYTFQIDGKETIIGFDKLNKILKKQNKNDETDEITSHNLPESFTNLIQSNTSLENNNENNSLSIQSNSTLQSNDLNFSYAFFVLNFSVLFIFLFKIIKIFFRSKKSKK